MNLAKPFQVVFFPAWFPTKTNLLAGKFVVDHAKAIGAFAEVSILFIEPDENLKKIYETVEETAFDLEVFRFKFKKFESKYLFFINYLLYGFAILYLLIKENKRFKNADLNHVHMLTRAAILPYLIKLFYQKKYVISEHWSRYLPESNSYSGYLRKTVTQYLVKKSSGITAVSLNLQQAMIDCRLEHQNSTVIYNVLDIDYFFSDLNVKRNDRYNLLHVSGLNDDVKNVTGILRAYKDLTSKIDKLDLVIVGDDDIEGPIIKQYALDLNLENVVFKGKLYGDDLLKCYQNADLFILNSNFDNQPYVVLEAMSCGLPVVATAVGGVPEMITKNTGILIPTKDDELLAKAILKVINKERIFDPEVIRSHVIKNYSYQKIGNDIFNFYNKALRGQ